MTILGKWGNSWSSVEIYPLWKDTKPDFVSKLLVHLSHRQQSTSQASLVNILFLRSGWCQPDAHPPSAQPPSAQPPSAHPPYAHSSCAQLPCVYTHLVHTHFVHTHPPCAQPPCAQPPSAHPPCTHPPCTDPLLHTYPITVDKLLPNYFPLLNLGFQNCDMFWYSWYSSEKYWTLLCIAIWPFRQWPFQLLNGFKQPRMHETSLYLVTTLFICFQPSKIAWIISVCRDTIWHSCLTSIIIQIFFI